MFRAVLLGTIILLGALIFGMAVLHSDARDGAEYFDDVNIVSIPGRSHEHPNR